MTAALRSGVAVQVPSSGPVLHIPCAPAKPCLREPVVFSFKVRVFAFFGTKPLSPRMGLRRHSSPSRPPPGGQFNVSPWSHSVWHPHPATSKDSPFSHGKHGSGIRRSRVSGLGGNVVAGRKKSCAPFCHARWNGMYAELLAARVSVTSPMNLAPSSVTTSVWTSAWSCTPRTPIPPNLITS